MIRDALLNSERFINLPDNTARICYVACLLRADDRGNLEGGPGHLVRLWRDFGVDGTEKAASIGQFLADQDLIRFYERGGKRYIHVPRFGQRMRSFKRACPSSPWCETSGESANSTPICPQNAANRGESRPEGKGSEEKYNHAQTLFARFWAVYPKRFSRARAEKAFAKVHPDEHFLQTILDAVERAKASEVWRREKGRYIPYPASWLNARGWEDELAPAGEKRLSL